MNKVHDAAAEQAKNLEVIAALAQETQRPLDEVKAVYEVELARFKSNARITDYVRLFASRSAKARLVQGHRRTSQDETSR